MSAERTGQMPQSWRDYLNLPGAPLPSPTPYSTPSTAVSAQPYTESLPPGKWTDEETALIRAGYQPASVHQNPPAAGGATPTPAPTTAKGKPKKKVRFDMAEPRARAARHKGQMNFGSDSRSSFFLRAPSSEPIPILSIYHEPSILTLTPKCDSSS